MLRGLKAHVTDAHRQTDAQFLSFRVGVDPDQDLQPCGDSFQVLQGVSLNVLNVSVLLPMKLLPSILFLLKT